MMCVQPQTKPVSLSLCFLIKSVVGESTQASFKSDEQSNTLPDIEMNINVFSLLFWVLWWLDIIISSYYVISSGDNR